MRFLSLLLLCLIALATSTIAVNANDACTWECQRSGEACQAHCPNSPYPSCPSDCIASVNKCYDRCSADAANSYSSLASQPAPAAEAPLTPVQQGYDAQLAAARAQRAANQALQSKKPAPAAAAAAPKSSSSDEVLVCEIDSTGAPSAQPRFALGTAESMKSGHRCHYIPKKKAAAAGLRLPAKKTPAQELAAAKAAKKNPKSQEPLFKSPALGKLNNFVNERRQKRAANLKKAGAAGAIGAKGAASKKGGKKAGKQPKGAANKLMAKGKGKLKAAAGKALSNGKKKLAAKGKAVGKKLKGKAAAAGKKAANKLKGKAGKKLANKAKSKAKSVAKNLAQNGAAKLKGLFGKKDKASKDN